MPQITDANGNVLVPRGSALIGDSGLTMPLTKNIVSDILIDPRNPKHLIAARRMAQRRHLQRLLRNT